MAATAVANKTSAREGDLRAQGEAMARRSRSRLARATGLLGSKVPTHDAASTQRCGQVLAGLSSKAYGGLGAWRPTRLADELVLPVPPKVKRLPLAQADEAL